MQSWMNLGVSGQCGWPTKRTEVAFGTVQFVLLPRTKENSASIHLEVSRMEHLAAMTTVNRFLSVASWAYKEPLQNHYGWSGNPVPVPVPSENLALSINDAFLIRWNPLPEPKQRLALALYREALTLNSIPYRFLGFFKIINILHKQGPAQVAWIKVTLPKLNMPHIKARMAQITASEPDVAKYLYESGRCAVAHAFADPLVDPDDLTHLHRLSADEDIVRCLAEFLIVHELNVPDYP